MPSLIHKIQLHQRRKNRIRAKVSGTALRPRVSVFKSLNHLFLQLIDDVNGRTLVSVSERELAATDQKLPKTERAKKLGLLLAKKATEKGISAVVFDRGGHAYHGRIQALADSAREGGLVF